MSSEAPMSLPLEMMSKIAFYIPEWCDLKNFMQVFRPLHALVSLEHLWQLHFEYNWDGRDLWPRLVMDQYPRGNERGMTAEALGHLAAIIKHYSEVAVDGRTNLKWIHKHIDPKTSITWKESWDWPRPKALIKWKSCRITRLQEQSIYQMDDFVLALQSLPYLEEILERDVDTTTAIDVFQFAASSSFLRHLDVHTSELPHHEHCTISTSMAKDLLQWIVSQPFQVF
ncbi:hypothetical protein AeRB84_017367 [Aphanomyces euteiches]|nr:hypothetical protein AeRB84_017367 [Aphanomyces euteiches]